MLRHNLLLIYRNFKRFKTTFLINVIGLSTGLACVLLIYLWVSDELSVDKFHRKDARLFRVMENRVMAEGIWTARSAPGILGTSMAAEMPEVEYAINSSSISTYTLSVNEKNLNAKGQFAGKDFFRMFSYDLLYGDEGQVLSDKNALVISDELAVRLFNTTENVVGQSIEFEHEEFYLISGIFRSAPANSSEQFDFVGSFKKYREGREYLNHWANTAAYAFVLVKEHTDVDAFNLKIANYIRQKTENRITHRTPFLKRYSEDYLYGKYENGVQSGGRITYVKLFTIIATFIMAIACINFMNLSTARASARIKEVGIKKAVGASRKALIIQYLTESVLMSSISMLLAILLVDLLLPRFNEITGKQLTLYIDGSLAGRIIAIAVFTGFIAGGYPALFLSGFKPASILKGRLNSSIGELWARQGLVVFQFAISVIFIVGVLVVFKQMEFIQSKSLGYDHKNIIYFPMVGDLKKTANQETLIAELKNVSGVINASSISHDLTGHSRGTYRVEWEGKSPDDRTDFEVFTVNYGMLETLGIQIAEGRSFSEDFGTEKSKIIFNEAAIAFMGMKDAIGKTVKLESEREIIGVVKNFHFQSLHDNIKPAFFQVNPYDTYFLMCRIEGGPENETLADIENLYKKLNPGFPFDYKFLDEEYQSLYAAEQRVAVISKYFAALAILISCMGLFGLVAFSAERRVKEIGIRKVLGSSVIGIIYLLSSDFTRLIVLSILIAMPLSFLVAQYWLTTFTFRIDLEWWYFIASALTALFVSWVTVAAQAWKAATLNPVSCLRDE